MLEEPQYYVHLKSSTVRAGMWAGQHRYYYLIPNRYTFFLESKFNYIGFRCILKPNYVKDESH